LEHVFEEKNSKHKHIIINSFLCLIQTNFANFEFKGPPIS